MANLTPTLIGIQNAISFMQYNFKSSDDDDEDILNILKQILKRGPFDAKNIHEKFYIILKM